MLQHHAVAGFVGGLAPRAMSFHKLLLQFALVQGEQSGAVLLAGRLDGSDRCSRGRQCWPPHAPEAPRHWAHSGQWGRKAKPARGAHGASVSASSGPESDKKTGFRERALALGDTSGSAATFSGQFGRCPLVPGRGDTASGHAHLSGLPSVGGSSRTGLAG